MTEIGRPKAVLVAVKLPDQTEVEHQASLIELAHLVKTLGYDVVGKLSQARESVARDAVLGEGKLAELAELTGGSGRTAPRIPNQKKSKARRTWEESSGEAGSDDDASDEDGSTKSEVALVAVDHDLTPSQARNLERAAGAPVLDRTGVIIEIFHRHAKSREARLEVEIARLTYTAPRLRESPSGRERRAGRGSGEAALELDRRKIRDRIAELRTELVRIGQESAVRRAQRRQARRVALVGYTNAGKSSLMRALTGSQVLVEDKLFATLDTTVRALAPEAHPRILVSDTVGFIKKLPHDLVASFKSTLDEALEASLILHVVDAADPSFESQLEVTRGVLREIGADAVPTQLLMNKVDKLTPEALESVGHHHPDAWLLSAHVADDVARLRQLLVSFFERSYVEREFFVPWSHQRLVPSIHENGRVLEEEWGEDGVRLKVSSDTPTLDQLSEMLARPAAGEP